MTLEELINRIVNSPGGLGGATDRFEKLRQFQDAMRQKYPNCTRVVSERSNRLHRQNERMKDYLARESFKRGD